MVHLHMYMQAFAPLAGFVPPSALPCVHASQRIAPPKMYLAPALGVAAAGILATSVKVVGTGDVQLIEKLGKFNRILEPGLHFTIPLIERTSFMATKREQVLDIPPQKAITRDNAPLTADAVVYWKVSEIGHRSRPRACKSPLDAGSNSAGAASAAAHRSPTLYFLATRWRTCWAQSKTWF